MARLGAKRVAPQPAEARAAERDGGAEAEGPADAPLLDERAGRADATREPDRDRRAEPRERLGCGSRARGAVDRLVERGDGRRDRQAGDEARARRASGARRRAGARAARPPGATAPPRKRRTSSRGGPHARQETAEQASRRKAGERDPTELAGTSLLGERGHRELDRAERDADHRRVEDDGAHAGRAERAEQPGAFGARRTASPEPARGARPRSCRRGSRARRRRPPQRRFDDGERGRQQRPDDEEHLLDRGLEGVRRPAEVAGSDPRPDDPHRRSDRRMEEAGERGRDGERDRRLRRRARGRRPQRAALRR